GKLGKKVAAKNLAVFTRQFSVMIDAGLPLVQCLEILGSQEEDKNFAAVILQTRGAVESGASLADAMRKYPKTFDPLFTNMIAAGAIGYAFRQYYGTPNGRRVIDGTLLRAPILGLILRKIAVARFCRTLATLISSGVPILDGLDITAKTAGNSVVEDAIMVTRKSIERGETIAVPLKET